MALLNKQTNYGIWLVVVVAAVAILAMWQIAQPKYVVGEQADLGGQAYGMVKGMPVEGIKNPPIPKFAVGCGDSDVTKKNYADLDIKKYTYLNIFRKGMVTSTPTSKSGPTDGCVDQQGNIVYESNMVREWYCRVTDTGKTIVEYKDIPCPSNYQCYVGACGKN